MPISKDTGIFYGLHVTAIEGQFQRVEERPEEIVGRADGRLVLLGQLRRLESLNHLLIDRSNSTEDGLMFARIFRMVRRQLVSERSQAVLSRGEKRIRVNTCVTG
ncbi:hypothetical protein D3C87_1345050 [compost metagenome]